MKKILSLLFGGLILTGAAEGHFLKLMLARTSEARSDRILRRAPEDSEAIKLRAERALLLPHERLSLRSDDSLMLRACFFPGERSDICAICVHGYRSSGLRDHASTLCGYLCRGVSVLLPDCRAHGESEGRVIGFGWSDRLDLEKWCAAVRERLPGCRIILHGVSMGSAAALCAAADHPPGLAGVVADCPYSDALEVFRHVTRKYLHLPCFPFLDLTLLLARVFCGFRVKDCSPVASAPRITVPVLLIHGENDSFVPTEMSHRIYDACRCPKRLLIVPGAEHGVSGKIAPRAYWSAVDSLLNLISVENAESRPDDADG